MSVFYIFLSKKNDNMAEIKKKNRIALLWNLTMIAELLGTNVRELKRALPPEVKEQLKGHKAYYYDIEAFKIIKSVLKMASDDEIKALLYPKGIS